MVLSGLTNVRIVTLNHSLCGRRTRGRDRFAIGDSLSVAFVLIPERCSSVTSMRHIRPGICVLSSEDALRCAHRILSSCASFTLWLTGTLWSDVLSWQIIAIGTGWQSPCAPCSRSCQPYDQPVSGNQKTSFSFF